MTERSAPDEDAPPPHTAAVAAPEATATTPVRPASPRERRSLMARARRGATGMLADPWPQRRIRRARIVVLVLLLLGPGAVSASLLFFVSDDPTVDVLPGDEVSDDTWLVARATLRNAQPARGELTLQLAFEPGAALADPDDSVSLREPVRLLVRDPSGSQIFEFPAGRPMAPLEVPVRLSGGSPGRYPFDRYDVSVVLAASSGPVEEPRRLPLSVPVDAVLEGFSVVDAREERVGMAGFLEVRAELARQAGVLVWSITFMVLAWALATGAALVTWTSLVYGTELPFWAWGFLTGVLFALPALRNNLPGSPPYGSLVDWIAFYWAVALVALSVVVLLANWNVLVRRQLRQDLAARTDATERTRSDDDA